MALFSDVFKRTRIQTDIWMIFINLFLDKYFMKIIHTLFDKLINLGNGHDMF